MRSWRTRTDCRQAARERCSSSSIWHGLSRELVTIRRDVPLPLDLDGCGCARPTSRASPSCSPSSSSGRSSRSCRRSSHAAAGNAARPLSGHRRHRAAVARDAHARTRRADDRRRSSQAARRGRRVAPRPSPRARHRDTSLDRCAPSSSVWSLAVAPGQSWYSPSRTWRPTASSPAGRRHAICRRSRASRWRRCGTCWSEPARAEGGAQHQVRLAGTAPSRGGAGRRVLRLDARELRARSRASLTARSTSWRASGCPSRCGRTRSSWPGKGGASLRRRALVDAARYCAVDSEIVLRLHDAFLPELEDHQLVRLLETIEMPLMPVLMDMESRGVCIDLTRLGEISRAFAGELTALERAIYHAAGTDFNINSTPQLRHVLFENTSSHPQEDEDGSLDRLRSAGAARRDGTRSTPGCSSSNRELSKLKSTTWMPCPDSSTR